LALLLKVRLIKLKEYVLLRLQRKPTIKPVEEGSSKKAKENQDKYENYKSILKDESFKPNISYDEYKKYIENL